MELKRTDKNSYWYEGTANIGGRNFKVQVLRFEEPSEFGINNGRISKLFVFDKYEELMWYDREWTKLPNHDNKEVQTIYETIIKQFN